MPNTFFLSPLSIQDSPYPTTSQPPASTLRATATRRRPSKATITRGEVSLLNFDSVIVDTVEYTRITAEVTIPIVIKQLMYDRNSDAVTLSWTSQPGKSYEILWSTDLTNYLSSGVVSAHPSDSETLAGPFANPAPGAKRVYFRLGEAATAP